MFAAERDRLPTPWATILGGPGFADSPATSNVTMLLTAGNYALVCYVGSAREDRHRYQLLKGMIRPLTVIAGTAADTMPTAELDIVLRGGSVQMPDTLVARHWRLVVRNDSERPADFVIVKVKAGYTLDQVRAWRPRLMTQPPRQAVGGMVFIGVGKTLMTSVTLEPGDYLFNGKHVFVR